MGLGTTAALINAMTQKTEKELTDVKNAIDGVSDEVEQLNDALTVETGINYFPQITSEEYVIGYYLKNGEIIADSGVSYINKYVEVNPNTQYTIGLIPKYGSAGVPWYNMAYAGACYNKEKEYISNITHSNGTFTTPANAKYIRINVESNAGISLERINEKCMLVKGSERPETYVQYNIQKHIVDAGHKIIDLEEKEIELEAVLNERTLYPYGNLYDSSKQTADTISPHYFVNGVPYSTTQFDSSWNCTAPIKVKENTEYIVGLVPDVGGIVKPWNNATYGWFAYKEDGTYISGGSDNHFTTPANTAYIRFNYYISGNTVTLNILNAKCVLVEGSALPGGYIPYGTYTIKEKIETLGKGINYVVDDDGTSVTLIAKYNAMYDIAVTLKQKGGNDLFDFYEIGIIANTTDEISKSAENQTVLMTTATDWFAPFIVGAKNNIDGDETSETFTGGNHQYNNQGSGSTPTAETSSILLKADNRAVSDGSGSCSMFEMIWTNLVQGYNTKKSDGSGREILQENHRLIFDGVRFEFFVDLLPLEDIIMKTWYGAQWSTGTIYPKVRYIGGTDREEHTVSSAGSSCGDNKCCHAVGYGNTHEIRLDIDDGYDLGDHSFISSEATNAIFTATYGKGYCSIISNKDLDEGKMYSLHGRYQFRSIT